MAITRRLFAGLAAVAPAAIAKAPAGLALGKAAAATASGSESIIQKLRDRISELEKLAR